MEESKASRELVRLESLPLDERAEALAALIDELEAELETPPSLSAKLEE